VRGCAAATRWRPSEDRNDGAIQPLERLLEELRANELHVNPSTARETEAIREIGYEIAIAIREVGTMLINVGWEQTFAANRPSLRGDPGLKR
jgi:ferric-dicitrate binding protein FerR (iron transport regulator)